MASAQASLLGTVAHVLTTPPHVEVHSLTNISGGSNPATISVTSGAANANVTLNPNTGAAASALAPITAGLTDAIQEVTQPLAVAVQETTAAASGTVDATLTPIVGPDVSDQLNVLPAEGMDPITPVTDVLAGEQGLPAAVSQILCPPITEIVELLGQQESPIGEGLTSLLCQLGILEYKFFTRWPKPGGGYIEKTQVATLGVPTLLDVNNDLVPDLTGTITLTGVNSIGLRIDRVSSFSTQPLPVSVEAVLRDPTGGALGREHIAFGYDALHDTAPGHFQLDTPIDTILAPSPNFHVDVTQTNRGERLALIGGLFDGTIQNRVNPTDVKLDWFASPDTASVDAQFGGDIHATLTQNRVGDAVLSGRITNGVRQDRFEADFDDIPHTVHVDLASSDGLDATYAASDPVHQLNAKFESVQFGTGGSETLLQKALIRLTDVPTGLHVHQQGDGGSVTTSGGPIGLTEVGIANGEPKFLSGEPAYVYSDSDGTLLSVAARIPGIESLSFSTAHGVSASAVIQSTPLLARLVQPGRTIDARIDRLPHAFDVGFDPDGGTLSYNGHGSGIDTIDITGDGDDPILARATKLRGHITGIPALLNATLSFDGGHGGFEVTTPDPIGLVELIASNGPEQLPAGGGQGVIYHDVPGGEYLVAARVLDLKKVLFDTTHGTTLQAVTRGGPFSLDFLNGTIDADGLVEDLPADATFGVDLDAGKFTFRGRTLGGSPQGIDRLTLKASSVGGGTLFGAADRLDALVQGIPADLDLTLTPDGDTFGVDASNAIGSIELIAANRTIDRSADLPAGGVQGVHLIDRAGEFVVGARILGLKHISANIADAVTLDAVTAGGLFVADVALETLSATARIADLPAKTHLAVDLAGGHLAFTGRNADDTPAGIDTLDLDASSTGALIGRADRLNAHLEGIPSDLVVDITQGTDSFGITANEGIDLVEIVAANRAPQGSDLPAGGEQGAKFVDLTGGEYVIGARIRELTKIVASLGQPLTLSTRTAGGPFGVRVTTDDLTGLARIQDLPSALDLSLDLGAGRITLDGHGQGVDLLTLDASSVGPLFGRADHLSARIAGIPSLLTLDVAQDGTGADVTASAPIGLVEIMAANRPVDPTVDLPLNNEQGAKLVDHSGGDFSLGARVRQLQRVAASFTGQTAAIHTKTESGPFGVRVITDDFNALGRIENLPEHLDATIDLDAGRITVDGHGVDIGRILFDATSNSALFGRAKNVHADIQDIPANLTLDIEQTGLGARIEASQAIGLIEVVASEAPIVDPQTLLPANNEQGAVYRDTSSTFLIAARVRQLKKVVASLGSGDVVTLQSQIQGGPFGILAQTDDLTANARFEDLPADVSATFDPAGGGFSFRGRDGSGNPAGVHLVTIDVTGTSPIFDRADRITARIEDLASDVDLTIDPSGPSANVTTSDPIGSLEFLATDIPVGNPIPDIAAGEQGAIYHNKTGQPFVLRARLLELRQIAFGLGGTSLGIESRLKQTPFSIDLKTDDLDADARIQDLPAHTDLDVDLDNGHVAFHGFDANEDPTGIDDLRITAHSPNPLFGRATDVFAHIADVPAELQVNLSQATGEADISASDPIGTIEILATEGGAGFPVPLDAPGTQGVVYHDRGSDPFVLAARVNQLRSLHVGFSLDLALEAHTGGAPFHVDVDTDDFGATADLLDLPANATLTFDIESATVTFDGSDINNNPRGIDVLDIAARLATPILGGGNRLKAHIEQLPAHVELNFNQTEGVAALHASSPIHLIELRGWEDGQPMPGLPSDQGVILHDTTSAPFVLAARIRDLEDLNVQFGDDVKLHTKTAGGLFTADIDTGDLGAQAIIDQLPNELDLTLNLADGKAIFDGHGQSINRIYAQIHNADPIFLGATDFEANLQKVPAFVEIGLPQGDDGVADGLSLNASAPIDQIDVRAHSPNRSYPTIAAGDAGAILDSTGGELELAIRVFKLQQIDVTLDPLSLHALMEGGRKFIVDAALEQSGGGTLSLDAVIDKLPSDVTLGLTDNITAGQPNGSKLTLEGSAPIDLVTLATSGLELLPGASNVKAEIEKVPRKITVTLPDTGELAHIEARDGANQLTDIGQLRLAAATGTATLPADTYTLSTNTATGDDQLTFHNAPGAVDIRTRLSGVKQVGLNIDPITLTADLLGGRKLNIDALIPNTDTNGNPTGTDAVVTATIDALPQHIELALGDNVVGTTVNGTKLTWKSTNAAGTPVGINEILLNASGISLLEGADSLGADIKGVPPEFSVVLPDREVSPTSPLATLAVPNNLQINELRLVAGGITLGSIPSSGNDKFTYQQGTALNIGLKLTGVKGLSVNLDPVNLTLDQNEATTKPIDLNATLPQTSGPAATITGQINKPSFHTEVGVTLPPPGSASAPIAITLRNGTTAAPRTMSSLSLNAANLGNIPQANFALSNISSVLDACMATDGGCRPTTSTRVPIAPKLAYSVGSYDTQTSAFLPNRCTGSCLTQPFSQPPASQLTGDYVAEPTQPFVRTPVSQPWAAAGLGRPYPALVSMSFDDQGSSGTSNATSSMITLNATIDLTNDNKPCLANGDNSNGANCVSIGNLRFHKLALDLGQHPTAGAFSDPSILTSPDVPRLYMYLDSTAKPFVMNRVNYPPSIEKFVLGTDTNPASADRRLLWIPGPYCNGAYRNSQNPSIRCGGSILGIHSGDNRKRDARTSGGLTCGGAQELSIKVIGITLNMLNFFGGQIIPVCGTGQGA